MALSTDSHFPYTAGDKVRFTWWGSEAIGWIKRIYVYEWMSPEEITIVVRDVNENLFTIYAHQIIEWLETS